MNPFVGSPQVCSELPKGSLHEALFPQPLLQRVPPVCSVQPPQDFGRPADRPAEFPGSRLFPLPGRPCPQELTGLLLSTQLPAIAPLPPRGLP